MKNEQDELKMALDTILGINMIKELEDESDMNLALRKALLTLIHMVQEDVAHPVTKYINFLLSDFSPVTDHFENELCEFMRDHKTRRWLNPDGDYQLLLHESFWKELGVIENE